MGKLKPPRNFSESIKAKTKEIFPDKHLEILDYFSKKFEFHVDQYKVNRGFTPGENFLKLTFLNSLKAYNLKLEECYYSVSSPRFIKYPFTLGINTHAPTDIFTVISPLDYIGSDGCGGSFFMNMSSHKDTFYHTWTEFQSITEMEESFFDLFSIVKPGCEELYLELKKEFNDILAKHNNSQKVILKHNDLTQLIHFAGGLTLSESEYMPQVKFNYSYEYFEKYLNNEKSDYYEFDNITCTVNAQLTSAFFYLYFSGLKEKLTQLLELTLRKTKGAIINRQRSFFLSLMVAEKELKNKIIINTVS